MVLVLFIIMVLPKEYCCRKHENCLLFSKVGAQPPETTAHNSCDRPSRTAHQGSSPDTLPSTPPLHPSHTLSRAAVWLMALPIFTDLSADIYVPLLVEFFNMEGAWEA